MTAGSSMENRGERGSFLPAGEEDRERTGSSLVTCQAFPRAAGKARQLKERERRHAPARANHGKEGMGTLQNILAQFEEHGLKNTHTP